MRPHPGKGGWRRVAQRSLKTGAPPPPPPYGGRGGGGARHLSAQGVAHATASRAEAARLLHWMRIVAASLGLTAWERTFCASIISRAQRGRYSSAKQVRVMQRLVHAFQLRTFRDEPGGEVLE